MRVRDVERSRARMGAESGRVRVRVVRVRGGDVVAVADVGDVTSNIA